MMPPTRENIKFVTYIILAISFMCIGALFNSLNSYDDVYDRNPLYWPLAIGFASMGGRIILGIVFKYVMPQQLFIELDKIKL
jgi:hypothetical protein